MMRVLRFMTFSLFLLASCTYVLASPATVSAHKPGQKPFFKVDDAFISLYHIQNVELTALEIPQTSTGVNYLVGTDISFKLDTSLMPVSQEAIARSTFSIDFGDGSKSNGIEHTHSYAKMGSYFVNVYGDDGGGPQLIESVLIHVVPDQKYVFPVAVIKVNGEKADDPAKTYKADFGKPVVFDGRSSTAAGTKIASYEWDFADGKSAKGAVVRYTYGANRIIASPILRVRDTNGFIVDQIVDVANSQRVGAPDAAYSGNTGNGAAVTSGGIVAKYGTQLGIGVLVFALCLALYVLTQKPFSKS